jgi:hypothetical protein
MPLQAKTQQPQTRPTIEHSQQLVQKIAQNRAGDGGYADNPKLGACRTPFPAAAGFDASGANRSRFITPASELKPSYPEPKLLAQEEAMLRLRLTIDAAGRVTAVDDRHHPAIPARRVTHWRR